MSRPIVALAVATASPTDPPHLVELGAIRVFDGEVVEELSSLIRPQIPIDPRSTELHGIDEDEITRAPLAHEVLARFLDWLGDDWMVVHDARRTARPLAFELARVGLEPPRSLLLDTLPLARELLAEVPDDSLEAYCGLLDLEEGEHHRALPDAVWSWKVFEACTERLGGDPTPESFLARTGRPATLALFGPMPPAGLKPRHRKLARACGRGAPVTLLYGEPPEVPVPLGVLPHFIYASRDRAYLKAECQATGLLKTYRLDRIHRVR